MKNFIAAGIAIGLALTSAGAHETVIESDRDGGRKTIKIIRHGEGDQAKHRIVHIHDCDGGAKAADATHDVEKDGKRKHERIVICSKPGQTSAEAAAHLSKARDRIAKDDNLSAEIKSKVLASLDAAIARHSKP
jgi:hypothetical protein